MNTNQVILFLKSSIITQFGIPDSLVFYDALYFSSVELTQFAMEKGIRVMYSTNYRPHGNGLAKSTNKNLLKILKRTVLTYHCHWNTALFNALWVDRVTPKSSIGNSPFFLVYGTEVILPPNLFSPSLQLA